MARLLPGRPPPPPLLLYIQGQGAPLETQQQIIDNIVAVLRRSPATVEHQDRHHTVVLTEHFPDILLDRSPGIVIELNMC